MTVREDQREIGSASRWARSHAARPAHVAASAGAVIERGATAPDPDAVGRRAKPRATGLLLTWIDDKGDFHVETRVADVPMMGRDAVRVVDPNKDEGAHADRVFVADLRQRRPGRDVPGAHDDARRLRGDRRGPAREDGADAGQRRTRRGTSAAAPSADTATSKPPPEPARHHLRRRVVRRVPRSRPLPAQQGHRLRREGRREGSGRCPRDAAEARQERSALGLHPRHRRARQGDGRLQPGRDRRGARSGAVNRRSRSRTGEAEQRRSEDAEER